jgi:hypothetical protein
MSNDRPSGSSLTHRARLRVEGLEVRELMSVLTPHQGPDQALGINPPSTYVSQQISGFDVTLTRIPLGRIPPKILGKGSSSPNSTNLPLTVNFTASLGSTAPGGQPTTIPASASNAFVPVNESITFPAGVTTETVHIPVNSGAANPGSVPIALSLTSTALDALSAAPQVVYLVTGPSAVPPAPLTFADVHLIEQGKTASGISITFTHAMSPASVEDIHNYSITTTRPQHEYDWFGLSQWIGTVGVPVPLKAATYDSVTNTVTLIPRKRLNPSVHHYYLENATPVAKHTLTDLQGNALQGNSSRAGVFLFGLNKRGFVPIWTPPPSTKIYTGN